MRSQGLAKLDYSGDNAPDASAEKSAGALSVRRLTLTDFRCYRYQRLDLEPMPVVLTGANGAGKTNLLEGLSFLVPGRGLRRARLSDVARRGAGAGDVARRGAGAGDVARREAGAGDAARREAGGEAGADETPHAPWGVAATVVTPAGEVEIGTAFEKATTGKRDKRTVKIDGETVKNQAALSEHVGVLWLTPQMDRLFLEGPGARRRFLDRIVFDTDPAHAGRVNAYEHALRERMRLLRDADGRGTADPAWLDSLEDTMATRGVAVAAARLDVARRIGVHLAPGTHSATGAFPDVAIEAAGQVETWLGVGPALAAEDKLRDRLARERGRDAKEGRTATGPHRSDLRVQHLGNGQVAERCSTGEQKALLVALVLGTARMRAQERGTAPLLLLDEIAAHLDAERLNGLFDEILGLGAQVWMTGTDAALFKPLAGRAQFFNVVAGTVTAA